MPADSPYFFFTDGWQHSSMGSGLSFVVKQKQTKAEPIIDKYYILKQLFSTHTKLSLLYRNDVLRLFLTIRKRLDWTKMCGWHERAYFILSTYTMININNRHCQGYLIGIIF